MPSVYPVSLFGSCTICTIIYPLSIFGSRTGNPDTLVRASTKKGFVKYRLHGISSNLLGGMGLSVLDLIVPFFLCLQPLGLMEQIFF